MTCIELIKSILHNPKMDGYDMDTDDMRKLIAIAYYMGRESAAEEICDKAREIFSEQRKRVSKCRYHKMAEAVQGDVTHIHSFDYAGDFTATFGTDETALTVDDLRRNKL